jgi:processive 1,2-diacylglycerol beta-glucosyltransferase
VRAAEALCAGAALHASHLPVRHLDTMDYVPWLFRKVYADFYTFLVNRYPGIWGYVYHATNHVQRNSIIDRVRRGVERLAAMRLTSEISRLQPHAIVCTHFLPAEILSRLRSERKLNCPVWVQVTDFDLHGLWVHHDVSGYFVASQEVACLLQAHGIPAAKVHVTGIPIMPSFAQFFERRECAAALGLDAQKPTVLLSGGGEGVGRLEDVAARLLPLHPDLQLIVLAGRNVSALKKLEALSLNYPSRLVALGYTKQVERVMACCDFAVIKPGGLTTSECLVMGLPMVLSSAIPGQEERNADFLLEQGVALKATHATLLECRVRELLASPAKLDAMRVRARALGKAQAALHVLNHIHS